MKRMRLWDSVSTILVIFGFGLYGSSCYYGVWTLVYAALGCVIAGAIIALYTQRCPFCRRYLGMMFFLPAGKRIARIAAAMCTRTKMFDRARFFRYAGHITV